MKPKKTFSVYVLLVGVMALLIVGGVLVFQVFIEATQSQLTPEQKAAVKPLDGKIDDKVVENLSQRITFTADDLKQVKVTLTPTPSPQPTPSLVATSSSQIASQSATIEKDTQNE